LLKDLQIAYECSKFSPENFIAIIVPPLFSMLNSALISLQSPFIRVIPNEVAGSFCGKLVEKPIPLSAIVKKQYNPLLTNAMVISPPG
jgi:hypothetical protein